MIEQVDERGLSGPRDFGLAKSEEYANQCQAVAQSAVSLTRIDAVDSREILEPRTPCVELVSEPERIVRHEIRSLEPFAHPPKNREVEDIAVVSDANVGATELTECRPDLLEERRRCEHLVVEIVLPEGLIRDGTPWSDERLEPVGDLAVADPDRCDLHDLRAQRVAVSRLEINSCEIPKMICERPASHVLHPLEHSQCDADRRRVRKPAGQSASRGIRT